MNKISEQIFEMLLTKSGGQHLLLIIVNNFIFGDRRL
jgi:hypothetical protein